MEEVRGVGFPPVVIHEGSVPGVGRLLVEDGKGEDRG